MSSSSSTESFVYQCECGQQYEFTDASRELELVNKGETNQTSRPFGGSCGACGRGRDGFTRVTATETATPPS